MQWETVENTGIPSWRKDLLSEEEVESPTIENVLELILAGAGNDAEVLEEENRTP